MKQIKLVSVFISLLLTSSSLFAQQERQPLRTVLNALEQRFSISFTYLDAIIEKKQVNVDFQQTSLNEILVVLAKQTGLTFTQIDERFIAINEPVFSQVCGYIVDRETDERIEGALVKCDGDFALSDKQGYFIFKNVRQSAIVSISSQGYDSLILTVNSFSENSQCKNIGLSLRTSLLSEVIINNYLTRGIQKKSEGSLSIETKELGILPGLTEPDVLFTIQALPGIQSIDETVSNINVRGGTHDQNLILWDGIKMYQQGHFFGLISAFNPYFTKEVNLIKNGTSAFYNDGVSSTIDIRSDDEVVKKFSGGGGLNMINADVFAKIPLSSKSSLHVATRRSLADIIQTPTYQSYYDRAFRGTEIEKYTTGSSFETNKKFHFYDISTKYLYDITSKDKLRLNFLMIHNSIDYQETELINSVPESKLSNIQQQNIAGSFTYSRLWNSKVRTTAMAYASVYGLKSLNNNILIQQRLAQENEVTDLGIKVDTRFTLSSTIDLFTGYQFFEVGVSNLEDINNPDFYRLTKKVLYTHVLFSELNYVSPTGLTNLRVGARANYLSPVNKFRFEPRITFTQKLNEYISLELLGELKSQTTTQVIDYQNDFLGVEKRRWLMADGRLVPTITSQQVSAGLQFHKNDFMMVLEGYAKRISDIITSSQGFQNQFQYVRSAGSYNTKGVEFLLNRRFSQFNSWFSYSYSFSDYDFKNLIPPEFPNNLDVRHRTTAGISYQYKGFSVSTGLNWHTGKPFTKPMADNAVVDNEIQYQTPNSSRLKNYWRVDVSARYKFLLSPKVRAIAGISVWNVFDTENVIDTYYQLNSDNQVISLNRNAFGLTPNAMFRIEF